jgi:hypothetical protein
MLAEMYANKDKINEVYSAITIRVGNRVVARLS